MRLAHSWILWEIECENLLRHLSRISSRLRRCGERTNERNERRRKSFSAVCTLRRSIFFIFTQMSMNRLFCVQCARYTEKQE